MAGATDPAIAAVEAWFVARGVPHFAADVSPTRSALRRAAPVLVAYLAVTVLMTASFAWSFEVNLLALAVAARRGRRRLGDRQHPARPALAVAARPGRAAGGRRVPDHSGRAAAARRLPGERRHLRGHRERGVPGAPFTSPRRSASLGARALGVRAGAGAGRQHRPAADARAAVADGLHRLRLPAERHVAGHGGARLADGGPRPRAFLWPVGRLSRRPAGARNQAAGVDRPSVVRGP